VDQGSFGQTNYRAYVLDTATGDHAVWFFGTCLDSVSVLVPRYAWKLPWHRARMEFDCRYDTAAARYTAYSVKTQSSWSPGRLSIEDTGAPPTALAGVSSLEAGLVFLTHPLRGYFFRRDGSLGSYSIWHGRATPTTGMIREALLPVARTARPRRGGTARRGAQRADATKHRLHDLPAAAPGGRLSIAAHRGRI
jgi:uncharacterized protein DUF2071